MIGKHLLFALPLILFLALPPLGLAESSDKNADPAVSEMESAPLSVSADEKTKDAAAVPDKTAKKPKPSASPAPSSSGEPTPAPSPTGDASPSASPDPEMQAAVVTPTPPPISAPPKPVQSDPLKFLDGFRGDYDTDLFTGSATYAFPLAIPPGRGKATPAVSLNYLSSGLNLQSLVGYGWSLPTNAIFRSTAYGTNNLYNRDDYAADVFGNYAQLIVTDTTNKIYAAKTEGSFVAYDFDPASNSWLATDKEGTKYFFGTSAASRHTDPANAARVYKWMLDKVQDTNGNTITLTYFMNSGQIYPETIRYSGSGSDPGIYELRFPREARPNPPLSYETGFGITTNYPGATHEGFSPYL